MPITAAQLHGCTARDRTSSDGSPLSGSPVKQVLALHPDLDLCRLRNWTELSRVVAGLAQAALLSHRSLLLPDLPCETAWLHPAQGSHGASLKPGKECEVPIFDQVDKFRWDGDDSGTGLAIDCGDMKYRTQVAFVFADDAHM